MKRFRFVPLALVFIFLTAFSDSEKTYIRKIEKHRKEIHKEFQNPETSPFRQAAGDFHGLDYFPPDPAYRVTAKVSLTPEAAAFEMPTSDPKRNKKFVSYAKLTFSLKGETFELIAYRNLQLAGIKQYEDHLFLPITDLTTGVETYGGGRYMDISLPKGNTLVLDFNLLYNPYCAYSDGWSCPIPPKENFLNTRLEAGVKNYADH
ncbi:MAG: DUF1684 domain-containing protein [Bacteroidia bacterium]|nr:DUF1684 domain-containing protein [Bacteroidia bacterium]